MPAESTFCASPPDAAERGLTVCEVARRYRVGADKVRNWIRRNEIRAVNTADTLSARPRWVITAQALAAFENQRSGGAPPKPIRRRRRPKDEIDYFPD